MKTFQINNNSKVILYGAASIGNLVFDTFVNNSIEVAGYIDKRADEIAFFRGKRVWNICDDILDDMQGENYFVFVSVKNVFEHTNIANDLFARGFTNIIFRSAEVLRGKGNAEQQEINHIYDLIEKNAFKEINGVPKTLQTEIYSPENNALIGEENECITAYVSIDVVYTDRKVRQTPWFDKSILSLLPHIDLFRYVAGEQGYSLERYLDFCIDSAKNQKDIVVTDAWKANVIKNRTSIYEHMNHSMELEPAFFIRNAPNAVWNANGYFNLCSGKHRAAYYASKRRKYIPLKMNKENYLKWINMDSVVYVQEELQNLGKTELEAPIPHPFFYNFPCMSKEFYYNALYLLFYKLSDKLYLQTRKIEFHRLSILCILDDLGFMERAFTKAKCNVSCVIDANNVEINQRLDKLLYCGCNAVTMDLARTKDFDIALIDMNLFRENLTEVSSITCHQLIVIVDGEQEPLLHKLKKDAVKIFSSIICGERKMIYIVPQNNEKC